MSWVRGPLIYILDSFRFIKIEFFLNAFCLGRGFLIEGRKYTLWPAEHSESGYMAVIDGIYSPGNFDLPSNLPNHLSKIS